MKIVDLTEYGYKGYQLREDGILINPNGRLILGNQNGQVRLPNPSGTEHPRVWKTLNTLVGEVFGWDSTDSTELTGKNLGFLGFPDYYAREDGEIIREYENKRRKVLKGSNGTLRMVDADGNIQWKSIKLLIGTAFIPNPTGRVNIVQYKKLRNQFQVANLLWTNSQRDFFVEDVVIDTCVKLPHMSIEAVSEILEMEYSYVRAVLEKYDLA